MTTAQSILDGLQRAMLLRAESTVGRPKPVPLAVDATGQPVFRTVRDKLGDIIRIYRSLPLSGRYWHSKYSGADLRAIRAEKGVGRPPGTLLKTTRVPLPACVSNTYTVALKTQGSQRAAARALGLNLSTFQRRLAKEQSVAVA